MDKVEKVNARGSTRVMRAAPWVVAGFVVAGFLGCSLGGGDDGGDGMGEGAGTQFGSGSDADEGENASGDDGSTTATGGGAGVSGGSSDPTPGSGGSQTGGAGAGDGMASDGSDSGDGTNDGAESGDGEDEPADSGGAGSGGTMDDGSDAACVVATRLNTCCGEIVAATPAEIEADACLVPWVDRLADSALASTCFQMSPVNCAVVLCAVPVVPSHYAMPDASGACAFVDECQSVDDCVRAFDRRPCCDCGHGVPREVAERDSCYWIEGEPEPTEACPSSCPGAQCGVCQEPEPLKCDVAPGQTVRRCQ